MKPLTLRDKWLAAFIPASLLLLVGWFFFLRPASQRVEQLRQSVASQGSLALKLATAESAREEGVRLQKQIASMRNAAAGQAQVTSSNPSGTTPSPQAPPAVVEVGAFDRNTALQQVSILSALYGMSLDGTTVGRGSRLPPALQEASASLAVPARSAPPQVWRVELSGSYPSMVRLLEGLQKTSPLIIPLNVSMMADKNERKPLRWVLTLWL